MAIATSGRPVGGTRPLSNLATTTRVVAVAHLANALTLSRLVAAVPLFLLVRAQAHEVAFWAFVAPALSDVADGFVAKRFNGQSQLGAILDPISDKALLACLFASLTLEDALPVWLLALVLGRDALLVAGTAVLRSQVRRFRVEPLVIGKLCTFLQLLFLGFVLGQRAGIAEVGDVIEILLVAVTAVTLASGLAYVGFGFRLTGRPAVRSSEA